MSTGAFGGTPDDDGFRNVVTKRVTLDDSDSSGGVFAWENDLGYDVMAEVIMNINTQAGQAGTVDIGVAADATTLSDTLIDGASVAATGVKSSMADKGTNGASARKVADGQFITGSKASGSVASMAGYAYVRYWQV